MKKSLDEKKALELAKRKKQLGKKKPNFYLYYLTLIISLVYITDDIASNISEQLKSPIAEDLFRTYGDQKVSTLTAYTGALAFVALALSLLYKPLSDRFGRKPFLFINTFGMSLGMVIIYLSDSIPLFVTGYAVISFFVPHDMQAVYIMETVPAKRRAKTYSILKAISTLSTMLVPFLRDYFLGQDKIERVTKLAGMPVIGAIFPVQASDPGAYLTFWRCIYLLPAVLGFVISFIALAFAKETDTFLESRIRYLSMSEDELKAEEKKKKQAEAQGGFFNALKFALGHKQLLWLFILMAFTNLGFIINMNYEPILKIGFSNVNPSGAEQMATDALMLYAVGSAVSQLSAGLLSDWLGRKPAQAIMAGVTVISLFTFTLGSEYGLPVWFCGIATGLCSGGFISIGDINVMMMSESSPTNLRSSVLASAYVIEALGTLVAVGVLYGLTLTVLNDSAIPAIVLCTSTPGIITGLVLVLTKVHETKGTDLDKVTGFEYD